MRQVLKWVLVTNCDHLLRLKLSPILPYATVTAKRFICIRRLLYLKTIEDTQIMEYETRCSPWFNRFYRTKHT